MEKSVSRDHHLSSLGKPPDANWWSSRQIFPSHPHTYDRLLYSPKKGQIPETSGFNI